MEALKDDGIDRKEIGNEVFDIDLKPMWQNIFVTRIEIESAAGGKILIPEGARNQMRHTDVDLLEGVVLAAGPDCEMIKIGDRVLHGKYSGAAINRNGRIYSLMIETDVVAIVDEKEKSDA